MAYQDPNTGRAAPFSRKGRKIFSPTARQVPPRTPPKSLTKAA
jgi:hypothetical protein